MIEKWELDASGNYKKKIIGSSFADNIIVNNPRISNSPVNLNSVLGSYKKNIDQLYGNMRWYAMHGGGGSGTGSGTGISDKPTLKILDINGYTISDGNISFNDTDIFKFSVKLENPRAGVVYSIVVTGGTTTKYFSLSENNNSYSITVEGLKSGMNEISINCISTSNGSYVPQKTHFYKQIAGFTINVTDDKENNISGTITKTPGDSFILNFIFTPSVSGTVKYKIDYSDLTINDYKEDKNGIHTGSVETSSPVIQTINFADMGVIPVGTTRTIMVSGSLQIGASTINTTSIVLKIGYVAGDGFLITCTNNEWNDISTAVYSNYYFTQGNNPDFDLYVQGRTSDYSALYAVYKSYYKDASGNWVPFINVGDLAGWTYNPISNDSVVDNLTAWQSNNIAAYLGSNTLRYINKAISFTYTGIPSVAFNTYQLNDTTSLMAAQLRIDVYIVNTQGNKQRGPLMTGPNVYKPDLSMKSLVEFASGAVPNYVEGTTYHSVSSDTYKEYDRLFFNFDTIRNQIQDTISKTFNYTRTGLPDISINMDMLNTNGKITGIVLDSSMQCFRVSGGSYGEITLDSLSNAGFIASSSDENYDYDWVHGFTEPDTGTGYNIDNGLCVEIVYKTDRHTDNIGTVLSMGTYDNDDNLQLGINVSLENAKMTFQGSGSKEINLTLTQNEFTQLDFVIHKDTSSNIIGKIYKNGIPQGLASIPTTVDTIKNIIDVFKGIYLGIKRTNNGFSDYTDVNIYGFRLYKSYLSDFDIMKNWLISKASYEKTYNESTKNLEFDYNNVINPLLRKNFFNSTTWRSPLWDYDNLKPASGQILFNELTTISGTETRQLPVILFTLSDSNNYGYYYVHQLYNEQQASENNNDITKRMNITFSYYSEIGNPITTSALFNIQGTSTQEYFSKNFELYFGTGNNFGSYSSGGSGNIPISITEDDVSNGNEILFTPKAQSMLPENEFTLKADEMDSAHANNAAIGKWINGPWSKLSGRGDHYFPLTPPQADTTYKYADKVKATLEGFPCLVFIQWGTDKDSSTAVGAPELMEFQGIYSFNLGRASSFNMGFKKFVKYELAINQSTSDSDDIDTWNDATNVTTDSPSMVNRYRIEPINKGVYSFENATNEPTIATGFQQFNIDLLKNVWDIKYKPGLDANETTYAYNYLQNFVKYIAYLNIDDVQKYWYRYDSTPNATEAITPDIIYEVSDPSYDSTLSNIFFTKDSSINKINVSTTELPVFKYTHEITAFDVSLMGTSLLSSDFIGTSVDVSSNYMSWEQGLFLYENNTIDKTWAAYNENFESNRPDLNKSISIIGDQFAEFTNKFCLDAEPTENLLSGDTDTVSGRLLDYIAFSRYFIIVILFGMIDSLGKNLTLRTWNLDPSTLTGLMYPSFYDMDTALGISNFGNEDVGSMVFTDYWMNIKNSSGESVLKVITEDYPEKVAVKNGNTIIGYNYIDPSSGNVLAYFDVNSPMPPDPNSVMYDMPNSHLWHVIRFLAKLTTTKYVYDGVTIWSPALEWSRLRAKYFNSVDDFIDNYFKKQNEKVGDFIWSFDYKKKYENLYTTIVDGKTTYSYSDMHFCHGTRIEYVRSWLKNRINFLDAVFNLKGLNTVDSNENYDNTMNSQMAGALSSEILGTNIDSVYTTTNATGIRLSEQHKNSIQTVYSSTPSILRINMGDITYKRYLLIPYVPTTIYVNINVQKDATWVVTGFSSIYEWDNLKDYNFINFDCKNWKLKYFDLSGLSSLTEVNNYNSLYDIIDFNLNSTPTNINDFTGMNSLENIDIGNTNIITFTPPLGNLKTLNLTNTNITNLSIKNLVNLVSIDITNCSQLTSLLFQEDDNLQSIIFKSNKSLASVTLSTCNSVETVDFDAREITSYNDPCTGKIMDNNANITDIKIIGQNDALKNISISNIDNATCNINLEGATSLVNLSLNNIDTNEIIKLPATIDTGSDSKLTTYNIYDSSYRENNPFSLYLEKMNLPAFALGETLHSFVTYDEIDNSTAYSEYSETIPYNSILNLSIFKNIDTVTLVSCPTIEYLALPWTTTPFEINKSITVNKCGGLKRIFGNLSYGHATFRNMADSNFRIENWSQTNDASVKSAFENIVSENSEENISDITNLIGDDNTQGLQCIPLKTRVTPDDTADFAFGFHSTGISQNDFYYVMAQLNLLNKNKTAAEGIHNLSHLFDSCSEMRVFNVSHLIFKYLAKSITNDSQNPTDGSTVVGIQGIFTNSNVQGLIYSPDTTINTTGDNIGTLTPFARFDDLMFANIGWNATLADNSTFFYNDGSVQGFKQSNIYNTFNSKIPVVSAQWNNTNASTDNAYFHTSYFLKNFPNAVSINNSFSGLAIYPDNVMGNISHKEYTRLFDGAVNLQEIINSFNFSYTRPNQYMIDVFGGDSSLDASFPTNITKIENSFNLSPYIITVISDSGNIPNYMEIPGYFFLTDNMFANFKNKLQIILPCSEIPVYDNLSGKVIGNSPDVTVTGEESFLGSNTSKFIVKAYCSYDKSRKFPYSIANMPSLQYAQAFFRNIDLGLSIYIDPSDNEPISSTLFINGSPNFDFSQKAGWNLDASVEIPSDILENDVSLKNASSIFRNIIGSSSDEGWSIGLRNISTGKDMPVYFPQHVFKDCISLENLSYGFANNHYMVGSIPSDILRIDNTQYKLSNLSHLFYKVDTIGFIYYNCYNINQSEDTSNKIRKHILLPWHSTAETNFIFDNSVSPNIYYDSSSEDGLGIYLESDDFEGYSKFENIDANFLRELKRDNGYICDPSIFDDVSINTYIDYMFAETQWQLPRISSNNFDLLKNDTSNYFIIDSNFSNYIKIYIDGNPFSGFRGRIHKNMFSHFTGTNSFEGIFYKSSLIGPYSYAGKDISGNIIPGKLLDPSTFWYNRKLTNINKIWSNNVIPRNVVIDGCTFCNNINLTTADFAFAGSIWFGYNSPNDVSLQVGEGLFDNNLLFKSGIGIFTNTTFSNDKDIASNNLISVQSSIYTFGVRGVPPRLFTKASKGKDSFNLAGCFAYDECLTDVLDISTLFNYVPDGSVIRYSNIITDISGNNVIDPNIMTLPQFELLVKNKMYDVLYQAYYYTDNSGIGFTDSCIGDGESGLYGIPYRSAAILTLNDGQDASAKTYDVSSYNSDIFRFGRYRS